VMDGSPVCLGYAVRTGNSFSILLQQCRLWRSRLYCAVVVIKLFQLEIKVQVKLERRQCET
jgi:hypothetical protein